MGLIFLAAFLGLLIGGTRGAVIGVLLAYGIRWAMQSALSGGARQMQSSFLETTFSIMGALCKADGVVSPEEIKAAENIFSMLHLSEAQRAAMRSAFNRGKAPGFDLDTEARKLAGLRFGRAPLLRLFLQIQCMAIAADGRVHPAEHEMLVRLAGHLGLGERDVAQLEALLRASTGGPSSAAGPGSRARLEDAYVALGLSTDADVAAIKRAYRRLMSENHPDKLAAKGLPESMRQIAEERAREINVAYDLIKAARGFS
jgi:DnaJ like chaperone protein